MTRPGAGDSLDRDATFEQWLDEVGDQFEAAWKSGRAPRIEEFAAKPFPATDLGVLPVVLRELVLLDLAYRWRSAVPDALAPTSTDIGDGPMPPAKCEQWRLEDYAARYPDLGPFAQLPLELVLQEYDVRRSCGDQPTLGEYAARFPLRHDVQGALADRESAARTTDRHSDGPPYSVAVLAEPRSMQIRCPHCHNPVEIMADRLLTDLTCGVCGSSFSLVGAGAETRRAATLTKVGHYELIEQLGIGGFGSVWKARDTELDRTVAVKIPRKGQLDPQEAELFLREARAAAQLRHPHIVSVHEVGREQDTLYIVSELVRGVTLKDWLTAHRLSEREAAKLCMTMAEALEHAHCAGVVHRDLKPSNIMLDAIQTPHLMDFGLAKRDIGEITMTVEGRILGTPAYMSPEQARGEGHHADRRSDIYSLGVILFELLTGELPFRGNERMILLQVMDDAAPSPRRLNRNISRDLETITLKCLEKDPRRRYVTAADLADELRRFLDGRPILARPVGHIQRAWRWCRRQPVVAGLAMALALALVVVVVVSIQAALEANRRADFEVSERGKAERQLRITLAERLAIQSKELLEGLPERSLLLAVEAVDATRRFQEPVVPLAEEALHAALGHVGSGETLSGHTRRLETVAISPDNRWIITVSDDGTARFWDQRAEKPWLAAGVLQLGPSGTDQRAIDDVKSMIQRVPWLRTVRRFPLEISADGHWLCIAGFNGSAYVCDLKSNSPTRAPITLDTARGALTTMTFSTDGKRLAIAGSDDGVVRLWETDGAAPFSNLRRLPGHQGVVFSLAMSSSGRWLAAGSEGGTVRFWDLVRPDPTDSALVLPGMPDAVVAKVLITPDDKWLGAGFRYHSSLQDERLCVVARLWDLTAADPGSRRFDLSDNYLEFGRFECSPNSQHVITSSFTNSLMVWRLKGADPTAEPSRIPLLVNDIDHLALGPHAESSWLALGSRQGLVSIRDLEGRDGSMSQTFFAHRRGVGALAISAEGRWLASGFDDGAALLWDLSDWARRRPDDGPSYVLHGHERGISALAISADSSRLITGDAAGMARVWDLTTPGRTADSKVLRGTPGQPTSWPKPFVVTADKRWLATQHEGGGVAMWDLTARDPFQSPDILAGNQEDPVTSIALTPDAGWLAMTSSRAKTDLRQVVGGESKGAARELSESTALNGVVISPDGHWLATRSDESVVTLWRLAARGIVGESYQLPRAADPIYFFAMSADSRRLVTFTNTSVRLWELTDHVPSANAVELISGAIASFTLSADSRWLAVLERPTGTRIEPDNAARIVYVCDLTQDDPDVRPRTVILGRGPTMLAISSDGRFLAAGSENGVVDLWNLTKFTTKGAIETPRTLREHDERRITAMAFNAANSRLISADTDGMVCLWDLNAERLENSSVALRGHTKQVDAAIFTPDDHWLVTAGQDGDYRVWNLRLEGPKGLLDLARRAAGRELTEHERESYLLIDPVKQ